MKKIVLIIILILLTVESISFFVLKNQKLSSPFLFSLPLKKSNLNKLSGFHYKQINPVVGWAAENELIEELGFKTKEGYLVLENLSNTCKEPYIVFITGGSTSDLLYNKENWPIYFERFLANKYPCYTIYIAAVGGYNSAQELLKTIEFNYQKKPDLHISYSACNDYLNLGLASNFENNLFEELLKKKPSFFLPSTISLILSLRQNKYQEVSFSPSERIDPARFWIENQNNMKGLAEQNNYKYIGILQPVINYSGYSYNSTIISEELNIKYLEEYSSYYPELIEFCANTSSFVSYTNIFSQEKENPFIDDCHLKDAQYQELIAESIFKLIDSTELAK